MRIPRFALKPLTLLAFAALSTLAAAQDGAPGRVGRIALAQGQVSIDDAGAAAMPAQVNWPVTSGATITTARGARTELRIGSTSIRLDGNSALEVTVLDDANLRLRLDYGSASVRVQDPDVLAGFELATPQARVRLQQPGRVRVDAERVRDTSVIEVFEGAALADGGGAELTLHAGRAAEFTGDDVRTLLARRDAFDDWSLARDRLDANAASARYVGTDMTGYEDLDRYGRWSVDSDYGPLWTPAVSGNWAPYSDGSWVWLDPWGWTWVDNSPWGYAPFHYGRWVHAHHRWSWAPGRHHGHAVWAPALVGWVGGAGWNMTFHDRHARPAAGWYPLTPHDRFVPGYRSSEHHLRWINGDVRPDPHRPHGFRPQGLTVVPEDRFAHRGRVDVAHAPHATPVAMPGRNPALASAASPPPPPHGPQHGWHIVHASQEHDREQGYGLDTDRIRRDGFIRQRPPVLTSPPISGQPAQPLGINSPTPRLPPQGLGVTSPTPHLPPQGLGVTSPTPHLPPQGLGITSPTPHPMGQPPIATDVAPAPGGWQHGGRREHFGEQRRPGEPPQAPPQFYRPTPPAGFDGRFERGHQGGHQGGWPHPHEGAAPPPAPAAPAPRPVPAPVMAPPQPRPQSQPQPQPQPVRLAAPAPQPARPAAPAPQHGGGEQHARDEQHGPHLQQR